MLSGITLEHHYPFFSIAHLPSLLLQLLALPSPLVSSLLALDTFELPRRSGNQNSKIPAASHLVARFVDVSKPVEGVIGVYAYTDELPLRPVLLMHKTIS